MAHTTEAHTVCLLVSWSFRTIQLVQLTIGWCGCYIAIKYCIFILSVRASVSLRSSEQGTRHGLKRVCNRLNNFEERKWFQISGQLLQIGIFQGLTVPAEAKHAALRACCPRASAKPKVRSLCEYIHLSLILWRQTDVYTFCVDPSVLIYASNA